MVFKHAQWQCDNCKKIFYMVNDSAEFTAAQLTRYVIASGRHPPIALPSCVKNVDETLCKDCLEFHEEVWAHNQRRDINKSTENFISNLTR